MEVENVAVTLRAALIERTHVAVPEQSPLQVETGARRMFLATEEVWTAPCIFRC